MTKRLFASPVPHSSLALAVFRFDLAPRKLALLCGAVEYRAALDRRVRLRAAAAFDENVSFVPACILLEGSNP